MVTFNVERAPSSSLGRCEFTCVVEGLGIWEKGYGGDGEVHFKPRVTVADWTPSTGLHPRLASCLEVPLESQLLGARVLFAH